MIGTLLPVGFLNRMLAFAGIVSEPVFRFLLLGRNFAILPHVGGFVAFLG